MASSGARHDSVPNEDQISTILPNGTIVAVAGGAALTLFRKRRAGPHVDLVVCDDPDIVAKNPGSGARHRQGSAKSDSGRSAEDGFAAALAEHLNHLALEGTLSRCFAASLYPGQPMPKRRGTRRATGDLVAYIASLR